MTARPQDGERGAVGRVPPRYALGRYECDGQPPIIVTDNGDLGRGDGTHGPWVRYRFEWESDEGARPVVCLMFDELLRFGYRPVGEP